jgi:threonyl-tRNA synthetase
MSQEPYSRVVVTLPDGSELAVEPGATVEDVAHAIGPGLVEDCLAYAEAVTADLRAEDLLVDVVLGDDTLQRRIRAGHDDRVPYMVVVGGDEAEAGTISVRDRQEREERGVDPEAFREHLVAEREQRRVEPDFLG